MLERSLLCLVWFGCSAILTGLIRRYALTSSLLDIPNSRSSHQQPTPRGGGVAFVLVFLLGLPLMNFVSDFVWALFGAGFLVAVVGFLDDHGHIKARWRLLAHFVAAAWGLYFLHGLPTVQFFNYSFNLGGAGYIFASIYLVWLLNLYNFMDGIDGIAAIEAICVCLGGVLVYVLQSGMGDQIDVLLLLGAAVAGFLCWNFPPAKIFMGDAGSGFLGIILGLFSLKAASYDAALLWSWLILLAVFIVDASWTLCRRFYQGEKVYLAHRSHAYQIAARKYGAHLPVSLGVAIINLCWLLPWAALVALHQINGFLGLVVAYLPLMFLAYRFKAGEKETA